MRNIYNPDAPLLERLQFTHTAHMKGWSVLRPTDLALLELHIERLEKDNPPQMYVLDAEAFHKRLISLF